MFFLYANNASTTMASGITNSQTTVTVQSGQGALFPAPGAGQQFAVTFEDTSGNIEVAYCTGRTGDTLTIVRGQESTTALTFGSGSRVEARLTEGMLGNNLQKTGGDTLSGTTNLSGILALGSGGSIQGGEFTGAHRGAPGVTGNQILVPSNGTSPATMAGSPILTTANIAANLPSGFDLAHTNMIVMWNGASNTIPTGWQLCDGTNGTPNLKDNFVVGAGNLYALGATGGSATTVTGATDPVAGISVAGHALTISELAAHGHEFATGNAGTYVAGGTGSGFSLNLAGSAQYITNYPTGQTIGGTQIIQNTGSGTAHTHGISGSLSHTHSYNLPPYYGLFYIMKL